MIGVRSCHNYITTITNSITIPQKWNLLCSTLVDMCWSFWDTAEQSTKIRIAEESSLYRYRTTTHDIVDEEVEPEEGVVRQMFPLYDSEFDEVIYEGMEHEMCNDDDKDMDIVCQFTTSEMEEISNLHQLFLASHLQANQHKKYSVLSSKYSLASALVDIIGIIPGM